MTTVPAAQPLGSLGWATRLPDGGGGGGSGVGSGSGSDGLVPTPSFGSGMTSSSPSAAGPKLQAASARVANSERVAPNRRMTENPASFLFVESMATVLPDTHTRAGYFQRDTRWISTRGGPHAQVLPPH